MNKNEYEKFWRMVHEFESMPDSVFVPRNSWLKPIHSKHKYMLEVYECDGSKDSIYVCVDAFAVGLLIKHLGACGLYAKATRMKEESKDFYADLRMEQAEQM